MYDKNDPYCSRAMTDYNSGWSSQLSQLWNGGLFNWEKMLTILALYNVCCRLNAMFQFTKMRHTEHAQCPECLNQVLQLALQNTKQNKQKTPSNIL